MRCFFFFIGLAISTAINAAAQSWRIGLSGGFVTNTPARPSPVGTTPTTFTGFLALSHLSGHWEVGVSTGAMSLGGSEHQNVQYGYQAPQTYTVRDHYGDPAIPLTVYCNYGYHKSKLYAFLGINAGVIFINGKQANPAPDPHPIYVPEFVTSYNHVNGTGFTLGSQLGFRRVIGHFEGGMQLGANFVSARLDEYQGQKATYKMIYLPLLISAGYRW